MTNAIVICADTFRADHLGCYGASWIKTPHLDQLAAEGIVFEVCFAEALPTIPARKAYFLHKSPETLIAPETRPPLTLIT